MRRTKNDTIISSMLLRNEGGYEGCLPIPPVYCPDRYTTGGAEAKQAVCGEREDYLLKEGGNY